MRHRRQRFSVRVETFSFEGGWFPQVL